MTVLRNSGKFSSDDVVSHPTRHAFPASPLIGTLIYLGKAVRVMPARGEWSTALCNLYFGRHQLDGKGHLISVDLRPVKEPPVPPRTL